MAYIENDTVIAILTRLGKQILSDNSQNFKITQFKFSDDEINYAQFDGSSTDAANTDILNTPILEPSSNENFVAQRYELFSSENNINNISYLDVGLSPNFSNGDQISRKRRSSVDVSINSDIILEKNQFSFLVRTFYGNDSTYYVSSTNTNIIKPAQNTFNGLVSSDQTQTFQNQTQAKIIGVITLTNDTSIFDVTIQNNIQTNQHVTSYNNVGMTTVQLTLLGNNTRKQFIVNILFYSPSILARLRKQVPVITNASQFAASHFVNLQSAVDNEEIIIIDNVPNNTQSA